MKHHPHSEIWPLMSGEAFEKLKADVAKNGLLTPILVYKDQILDGRNRERACREAGISPRYEEANVTSDAEALALIGSLNQYRRHLSHKEMVFAAARLAKEQNMTQRAAAQIMKVGQSSVSRAGTILTKAPEAEPEILSGKTSISRKWRELTPKRATHKKRPQLVFVNRPTSTPLTREEVDPEFTGTAVEWVDKYGHTQVMTAAQYATARFETWAKKMSAFAKDTDWPEVDLNWLRHADAYNVAKLSNALEVLRLRLAKAEALLKRANDAARPKAQTG